MYIDYDWILRGNPITLFYDEIQFLELGQSLDRSDLTGRYTEHDEEEELSICEYPQDLVLV